MRHSFLTGALVVLAALAACDDGAEPGSGGEAGSGAGGGTGGSGGAGGTGGGGGLGGGGGTGGSGGVAPSCGNGTVDPGELCDDGNAAALDGCSPLCEPEVGCASPIDYFASAVPQGGGLFSLAGNLEGAVTANEGSCGGIAQEAVVRYVAPGSGLLIFELYSDAPLRIYARTACEEPASELVCSGATGQADGVTEGQELFFFVDAAEEVPAAAFELLTRILPYVGPGEPCDPAQNRCEAGLRCDLGGGPQQCVVNNPPTAGNLRVVRGGPNGGHDFALRVDGADPDGDVDALYLRFENPAGDAVVALDLNGDGVTESREGTFSLEGAVWGQTSFSLAIDAPGFFAAVRVQVSQVVVGVVDSGNARSELITAPLTYYGPRTQGQECDPEHVFNYCVAPLACGADAICG